MEKNTILHTIEMSDESGITAGEGKITAEVTTTHAPSDLPVAIIDTIDEDMRYAFSRLKTILTDRFLSDKEELTVALTIGVRTVK